MPWKSNANEAEYEEFLIFGQSAILAQERIDRATIPEGVYAYDLRDDGYGEPCELKDFVTVNFYGTVLTKLPIKGTEIGVDISFLDYNFLDGETTLADFCEEC